MNRLDREDLTAQQTALAEARAALAAALLDAASEATAAAKLLGRKGRSLPRLDEFHTATRAVARAEEALDLAALDLRTAAGEDA